MSWFSNQWNRWNNFGGMQTDVEWLEVVWGRQQYVSRRPTAR